LLIGSEAIHRIVATAFKGEPPTSRHIVDHIDTNRQNNRPENLRWQTKLENALNNPITRHKIEFLCGTEAFLKDPSILRNYVNEDPNFEWMRTVTPEEAQISWQRLINWTEKEKGNNSCKGGSLGEWIFIENHNSSSSHENSGYVVSQTPNAIQKNWKTPCEFPCCPQEHTKESLIVYADNLKNSSVFCRNEVNSSLVSKSALSEDRQLLFVLTESSEGENAVKPWAVAKISYENGLFVHTSLQSYFTQEGAEKQYFLAQGLEWNGGDSIDDYC